MRPFSPSLLYQGYPLRRRRCSAGVEPGAAGPTAGSRGDCETCEADVSDDVDGEGCVGAAEKSVGSTAVEAWGV